MDLPVIDICQFDIYGILLVRFDNIVDPQYRRQIVFIRYLVVLHLGCLDPVVCIQIIDGKFQCFRRIAVHFKHDPHVISRIKDIDTVPDILKVHFRCIPEQPIDDPVMIIHGKNRQCTLFQPAVVNSLLAVLSVHQKDRRPCCRKHDNNGKKNDQCSPAPDVLFSIVFFIA